jgi:hypothetical protein
MSLRLTPDLLKRIDALHDRMHAIANDTTVLFEELADTEDLNGRDVLALKLLHEQIGGGCSAYCRLTDWAHDKASEGN